MAVWENSALLLPTPSKTTKMHLKMKRMVVGDCITPNRNLQRWGLTNTDWDLVSQQGLDIIQKRTKLSSKKIGLGIDYLWRLKGLRSSECQRPISKLRTTHIES